jgi:uncharacterized SAM-binding protein YcdF (DUF218 family)
VFFFASKIFWMIASPISLLLFAALIGVLLCFGRRARFGRGLALIAILVLVAAATLPVGKLLIAPLEDRFPLPSPDLPPPEGIIVLGGAIDDGVSKARGETVFNEGGERLTEAVVLAKRYPEARRLYQRQFVVYRRDFHRSAASQNTHVANGDHAGTCDDRGQITQH